MTSIHTLLEALDERTISIFEKNKNEDFHIRLIEIYGKP